MDTRHDEIFSGLRQNIKSVISLYEEQKKKNIDLRSKNQEFERTYCVIGKHIG